MRIEDFEDLLSRDAVFAPARLSPSLEREFLAADREPQRRQAVFGLTLGLVFYLALLPIDWLIVPDLFVFNVQSRMFVGLPFCLLMLWVVANPRVGAGTRQAAVVATALNDAITVSGPLATSSNPVALAYLSADFIILAFMVNLVGVTTRVAAVACAAVLAVQLVAVLASPHGSVAALVTYLTVGTMVASACVLANWCLQNERRRSFAMQRRDEGRLRLISEQRDLLERLAAIDPLTGLANRRGFDAMVDGDAAAAGAAGGLALAMIDVDHFKLYNDTYGHLQGDEVLKAVAATLVEAAGPGVRVGRLGGEEFALAAGGLDRAALVRLGERVRSAVQALAIPHARSTTADVVTISVGVAEGRYDRDAVGRLALFSSADQALYAAKRSGRNRLGSAQLLSSGSRPNDRRAA